MRVARIVRQLLGAVVADVHVVRLRAVVAVVEGIIAAGRLSVVAVGRALGGRAFAKHGIKRVDRLLSNRHVYRERWLYFNVIASRLLGPERRPVLLVDWTKVTDGFHALVAALPSCGRGIAVYEEVHPEVALGNARIQASFLRNLRRVLPTGCRPVIVTDAGFHGPFFREVATLGWDFVGRLRTNGQVRPVTGGPWDSCRSLYVLANPAARDLGTYRLYKTRRRFDVRLVLVGPQRFRGRHPWRKHRVGGGGTSAKTIAGAKDPWLLATSLTDDAAAVVETYRRRMQIEETFRDVKNPRFGWCLRHVRGYSAKRLTVLLLLVVLAALAVTLLGLAAERRGHHRRYQANTETSRVLSVFVLGLAIVRRRDFTELGGVLRDGLRHLRTTCAAWMVAGHPCPSS
jgi:hypothetical protein